MGSTYDTGPLVTRSGDLQLGNEQSAWKSVDNDREDSIVECTKQDISFSTNLLGDTQLLKGFVLGVTSFDLSSSLRKFDGEELGSNLVNCYSLDCLLGAIREI